LTPTDVFRILRNFDTGFFVFDQNFQYIMVLVFWMLHESDHLMSSFHKNSLHIAYYKSHSKLRCHILVLSVTMEVLTCWSFVTQHSCWSTLYYPSWAKWEVKFSYMGWGPLSVFRSVTSSSSHTFKDKRMNFGMHNPHMDGSKVTHQIFDTLPSSWDISV